MPFKLFHRHKKDKQMRDRSKSCIDLSGEPPDPDAHVVRNGDDPPAFYKGKRKSSLQVFHMPKFGHHSSKNENHVTFKAAKKDKALQDFLKSRSKSIGQLNVDNERKPAAEPVAVKEEEKTPRASESLSDPILTSTADTPSVERSSSDSQTARYDNDHRHYIPHSDTRTHNHNHHHHRHYHTDQRHKEPKKSASCGSQMERLGRDCRERRRSDIAQLDNYIEYLRRTNTDDGNMANRLCCAQILRMSFVRLQQMHINDALHSSSHDSLGYGSNQSSPPANHRRRKARQSGSGSHHELDSSSLDEEDASEQRLGMDDSDSTDGPINVNFSPDGDSDGKPPSEVGSFSAPDSEDSDTPELWAKSLRREKRKSIPVFPVDIEIF